MHLYNNMKSLSKGLGISKTMWPAKSTTDYFFNMNMESIKKVKKTLYASQYMTYLYVLENNHLPNLGS